MKRRLRRFVLVGLLITEIDLAVLLALGWWAGWAWGLADAVSVSIAAVASYVVHRAVTFADDRHALIDHQPRAFAAAVAPSLVADVAIVSLITWALGDAVVVALLAKLVAVGVAASIRLVRYRRVLLIVVRADQAAISRVPLRDHGPRLSVVLPAYQADAVVGDSIHALREALGDVATDGGLEIVVADDGSSDATAEVAAAAGARVVSLPENRGKGAAVRAGMLGATGRVRIFTDVDLAYPPHQLRTMLAELERGADVVVGSRRHAETEAVYRGTRLREVGSLVFNLFTHVTLLGQYRDTQSGIKGFRADAAELIFSRTAIDGFAFDVEVLHLVERYRLSLTEVPVVLDNVDETTVRLAVDTLTMVRDVFAIRRRGARGYYDLDPDDASRYGVASR